jgi:hypothetical protein
MEFGDSHQLYLNFYCAHQESWRIVDLSSTTKEKYSIRNFLPVQFMQKYYLEFSTMNELQNKVNNIIH